MFTNTEVNGWFQTLNGLSAATGSVPTTFLDQYLNELNGLPLATPPVAPTATMDDILHNLKNFPFSTSGPGNVETSTFFRTTVAQFVLREFQAAFAAVPTATGTGSQYDNWVARIIADPTVEQGTNPNTSMSFALANTTQFSLAYDGLTANSLATTSFITKLWSNLGMPGSPGAGALANVNVTPVWQVLQAFVTSPNIINNMYSAVANFQDLLVSGGNVPGSIFTQPNTPGGTLTLTTGIDTPATGFSGGAGATAMNAGAVFSAAPGSNVLGLSNTLNGGDDLEATGAAAGNSTLNYTAILPALGGNPALVTGLVMNGVSGAVITNLNGAGVEAGFSGNITGLTAATLTATSTGPVELGTAGNGLNTALTNVTVNASHNFTAHMTAAALAAAPAAGATVTLNGGVTTVVALDSPATTGYAALTVNSAGAGAAGTANDLTLNLNEGVGTTNTAAITVTGAEALVISGSALNIDNLHNFTGNGATADTGGVDAIFANADGLGNVAAVGGSGVNTFEFGDVTATGAASFTTASNVNGGSGATNTLIIDADTGAILLPGVGSNITHILTIENNTVGAGGATGTLSADLSLMGSATTFDLNGTYGAHAVNVTDITNAFNVEFSGSGGDLTLTHLAPLGGNSVINFEMSAAAAPPEALLTLTQLNVAAGLVSLNIDSTGAATTGNVITDVGTGVGVNANVDVNGGTHLTFGSAGSPYLFTGAVTAGAVINADVAGSVDTGGVEAWLGLVGRPNGNNPSQTFIGGTGPDTAHVLNFEATVVNFTAGGQDTVDFHEPRDSGAGFLTNNPAVDGSPELYNSVIGFTQANDTIDITNGPLMNSLQFTNSVAPVNVPAGATTGILGVNTDAVESGVAVADNWIKLNTPVPTIGATAQAGFNSAIGAGGQVTVGQAAHNYLASYYDSSNSQAVFVTVASNGADHIVTGSAVDVIGLIKMTATDYNNLAATNLHWT